jgi:hypothetical protein
LGLQEIVISTEDRCIVGKPKVLKSESISCSINKYAMPSVLINTFFEWIDNDLEEGAYL